MIQGASDPDGSSWGWGWDGDGDDDWDSAVLTLLALAVVAATALALHWFGSGQDQEAAGPASTGPRAQPSQAGGAGPALPPKVKVSGGVEGHNSGLRKSGPPGLGQGSPAAAGVRDHRLPGRGGLTTTAAPPLKTLGEVASAEASGQQHGNSTPEVPRSEAKEHLSPGAALLGRSKVGGAPAPLLIHFTPRSPDIEVEAQAEAGGDHAKALAPQAPAHTVEQDTSSWKQGVGPSRSAGRGSGSQRWQAGDSSGDRTCRSPKLDPRRLGAVVSVWDAVDAASSLSAGPQRPPRPQELPPPDSVQTGHLTDGSERGCKKSGPQPAPVLALDSGAKTGESSEAGPGALREFQGSPPSVEGWPWARREVLVTRSFNQTSGSMGPWPEEQQWGHPLLSQGQETTVASIVEKAEVSGDHSFFSSGPAPVPAATPAPAPATCQAPAPAATSAPTSNSMPACQELCVAICKGNQEGQISTSWGNLISMVLKSHPFPRQEKPQGMAQRAALESSGEPSTPTDLENMKSGSPSERATPSLKDRQDFPAEMVTEAGTGGLAEAGCQPQQRSSEMNEATVPKAPSQLPEKMKPGPTSSPTAKGDPQPVPRPRKRSMCEIETAESSERVSQAAPGQGPGERPSPVSGRGVFTEKQKEAHKLMVFLQKPGSWGVVEGPRKPSSLAREAALAAALQRRVDLGSCLDVLAFAQRHGKTSLAQETYALMSDNLLHVLGDPNLYRQLSGTDRERILNLRTGRGQAVLGVLVLPSLYQVGRSGLTRGPHMEEAPAVGPAPLPPPSHLHMFNPQENTWRLLTQVPEEVPLRGCGLCTMYNYLFLAGGIRGSGAKAVCSNEVFCYNPLTNIWSQVRPMQQARAQLKLVALDGLLYAIGGECLYSMECYDPRTDTWTSRAPLPAGTFPVAHEAVACRGDIYVTGGHLFYRLLRYSPVKDAWDECPYSASHRRSSDMVALGGFLYRFDLLRGVGAAVMRYNTVTGSWSRAAPLPLPDPVPLHCTVLGNTIYCLNHQVTATFTVSEGTAQFQAKELQPFPLGSKGVLCPFILTLPPEDPLQTAL
ncbi:kelch domain-containing protein 7B [Artibeus jamaicensis]|uniref:kelch domain-containing protein 7B n=1 Tax=Artibeus jamaicensis TaxID=9417 RepID=UPI00235B15B8|nr:kelch domain-containing protein 7B [Artibeus jamaicensis]